MIRYLHLQPTQLLVGIAMVARGEFAYLVADIAQSIPYEGGDMPGSQVRDARSTHSPPAGFIASTSQCLTMPLRRRR